MYARCIVTGVLLAGLLAGCGFSSTRQDPWYRAPPTEGDLYWTWPNLDAARLHEVIEDRQADAQALLEPAPLVELTAEQAAEYVGQVLPDAPGTQPYLVRGLYRNPATGRFRASYTGEQLVVIHASLGSTRHPLQRRALVLQLEQKPGEVYVYATTAK